MALRDLGPVVTELRKTSTHIQWRPKGIGPWIDLVPLTDLIGHSIEMRKVDQEIQWRIEESTPSDDWKLLFDLSDLKGDQGDQGQPGHNAHIVAVTSNTHIVYETSSVTVTMLGPETAKRFHFEFYLEDVLHAINNYCMDIEAHPTLFNFIKAEIAKAIPTLELSGDTLCLRQPNGEISSSVNIGTSNLISTEIPSSFGS